jgi:tryptophan synthase alpha chain
LTGIERLDAAFARARAEGRGALIPYFCAGDPDPSTSALLLEEAARAGSDVIELGIPYGDPLADGPTIAAAAQRALAQGTGVDATLALADGVRRGGGPPVLLFTYVNPILQYGIEGFADALVAAGAAGAIVPDVPIEEMGELRTAFAPRGLALPLLIAPSTPPARALALAEASDGFVYVVSRLGVTGAKREPDFAWIEERVAAIRAHVDRPVAIGFGIATGAHARRAVELADAAIVGSALIDAYAGTAGEEAAARVRTLLAELDAARRPAPRSEGHDRVSR